MKKIKKNIGREKNKKNTFDINTGYIFLQLSDPEERKWEDYDRKFLTEIVEVAFKRPLLRKKIFTVEFKGNNGKYLEGYKKNRYPFDLEKSKSNKHFPFPEYFLMQNKSSAYDTLIGYDEDCIIEIGDPDFDLFFALQFSLTNIVDGENLYADEFLKFHLTHSFKSNRKKYKNFLERICIKYNDFLKNKYKPIIDLFNSSHENSNLAISDKNEKIVSSTRTKIVWKGQSSSLTYLFRQLKNITNQEKQPLIANSYEEIADFLKNNFSVYEKVKYATILGQLKNNKKPKKAIRTVTVFV